MNKIVKKIINYQNTRSEFMFEEIVEELTPFIENHLKNIPKEFRDDVRQEMLMALYEVINKYFKVNEKIAIEENLFLKRKYDISINELKENNKDLNDFIEKYGIELLNKALKNKEYQKTFNYEYMLFCNEKQFISYLNKTFNNLKIDSYNEYSTNSKYVVKSLNEKIFDDIELVELIEDNSLENKFNIFQKYNLTNEEIEFLLNFFEYGRKLTEQEVALKYNVSQQYISKKLKKIKKKLI